MYFRLQVHLYIHPVFQPGVRPLVPSVILLDIQPLILLPLLPGSPAAAADAPLTDDEIKIVIFESMPEPWQEEHLLKHGDESGRTLEEIKTFMERYMSNELRSQERREQRNNNSSSNRNNNNNNSNNNSSGNRRETHTLPGEI